MVERRACNQKVAGSWFDSRTGNVLKCPWKRLFIKGAVEDTRLEAKDTKKIPGQTLSRPRTGMLEPKAKDQGHKCKCSPKKRPPKKFFMRSPKKNGLKIFFQPIYNILITQKIVLSSSRGLSNFRGIEALRPRTWRLRPRTRTSKCVLEDVLEAKDVLEDSTSALYGHFLWGPSSLPIEVAQHGKRFANKTQKSALRCCG